MRELAEIETLLDADVPDGSPAAIAADYLALADETMLHWLAARELEPTDAKKEGFSLLAWHRQACKGDPTFNACRETCREIAYHYNLVTLDPEHEATRARLNMMRMVTKHLYLFITNKMMDEKVGEFCCSSKVNRLNKHEINQNTGDSHG